MMTLLLIPQGVDLSQPAVVAKARHFKNAVDDWQSLDDKDCFEWQEFILRYGSYEDTTSDNWLDDILLLSMETTLRAEVEADIVSIKKEQHGSISTLRCIIKRMVIKTRKQKMPLQITSRASTSQSSPGKTCPPLVSASMPSQELLARKIYRLILFAKFLRVLVNHRRNSSMTFVQVKLPSVAEVSMLIS